MAKQNRTTLREYFKTGKSPNQNQYKDLIDSKVNMLENNVGSVLLTGNITASGDEGESHLGRISASNDVHVLNLIATGSSGTIQTTGDLTVGISGEPTADITSKNILDEIGTLGLSFLSCITYPKYGLTAITDFADALLQASAINKSCIRCSLAGS